MVTSECGCFCIMCMDFYILDTVMYISATDLLHVNILKYRSAISFRTIKPKPTTINFVLYLHRLCLDMVLHAADRSCEPAQKMLKAELGDRQPFPKYCKKTEVGAVLISAVL